MKPIRVETIPAGRALDEKAERGDWVKLTNFEKHILRSSLRQTHGSFKKDAGLQRLMEKVACAGEQP